MTNLIFGTDSYKQTHHLQTPPGTEYSYSYVECRGGMSDSVFFGLQAYLKRYLEGSVVSQEDIEEAAQVCQAHGVTFNREGWEHIVNVHEGKLPLRIKAVSEGLVIPVKNILMSIENTDRKCHWLTSCMETALLRAVWYPTTVATISRNVKKTIYQYLKETGDISGLPFKLHDFGARGVSSAESAALGGLAHLVNFQGTDTMEALLYAGKYYNEYNAGFSIPASEHSTMTTWGRENEVDAYRNMLKHFAKPGSILAVVSDSYDIYNACENIWGGVLKQEVLDSGATVVVRPDSGNIIEVTEKVIKILDKKFGSEKNNKGYKVLHPSIRVIQGDGCSPATIEAVLKNLKRIGYSADNIAFGMGAGLLQKVNRDTLKFAMKCSAVKMAGETDYRPVFKEPITDPGKNSKRGRMTLVKNPITNRYSTVPYPTLNGRQDLLETVFENGEVKKFMTLKEVRENASLCK